MDKLEIIKQAVIELLGRMDLDAQVSVSYSNEEILADVQTQEAGFLIGQAGVNLDAFQHLVKVMVGKKINEPVQFTLDVNDYRRHRKELLRELAQSIAKQALDKKTALVLQPMSAYERRIIHSALADFPQINTESIGQEPKRRVVVKPMF